MEFIELVDIMETKGNKFSHNVKMCWISMLSPMKHVICKYRPLLMKMALDFPTIALAASNLELNCDVEILLSLVCFVPMLEIVKVLMKFAQLRDFLFMIYGGGEHLAG
jgi:hypothetical protein